MGTTNGPPGSGSDDRSAEVAHRASPRGLVSQSAASSRSRVPGRPQVAVGDHRVPAHHGRNILSNSAGNLTVGSDGNLWFPQNLPFSRGGRPAIDRITPAGTITEFPLPAARCLPSRLTLGPDGNLWFQLGVDGPDAIGRITPAGVIALFPLPEGYIIPSSLTVGPDGNLWFPTDQERSRPRSAGSRPSGAVTEFPLLPRPLMRRAPDGRPRRQSLALPVRSVGKRRRDRPDHDGRRRHRVPAPGGHQLHRST